MKQLPLFSTNYQLTVKAFSKWLEVQGYSKRVVDAYPSHLKELFFYAEHHGITHVKDLTAEIITGFSQHVRTRVNHTKGGGLSNRSVNYLIKVVKKFLEYLRINKNINLEVELSYESEENQARDILTFTEIDQLFKVLESGLHPVDKQGLAILSILYGAGLRKTEIQHLDLEDFSMENHTIHVRHGKGNKERVVPITPKISGYIKEYLQNCRDVFVEVAKKDHPALFINVLGERLPESSYYQLLKKLIERSGIASLYDKHITLHTFRHTIATHLIYRGMPLEYVQQFLGHNTLDSTSVYLHYAEELKHEKV